MEHEAFVERVFKHMPASPPGHFTFTSWDHAGRPTKEAFGIMPIGGVDPEKVMEAVMSVDQYRGNLDHVEECRAIADDRYPAPQQVRFYQRLNIPLIGSIHHELVLHRLGERNGYHVAAWDILKGETHALSTPRAVRSDYNHGAWLAAPGVLGYALGSAPRRDDVGFLKWKALTKGADVAASKVLKGNIEGMARWAARL